MKARDRRQHELDAIVTRYECRYTFAAIFIPRLPLRSKSLQRRSAPTLKPFLHPAAQNLTLNGKEKMDCGNTENTGPKPLQWSLQTAP